MEHNKAPGPDGFPTEFYQYFWEIIKGDLMELFGCLHTGQLELFRINFREIILVSKFMKWKGFNNLDRYAFLMFSLNFYEAVTIRLNFVVDQVVHPTQMAFMQGRYILDGVVTLHETVHELHRKEMTSIILNIGFEKAYDKVKWSFLQQTLKMKGFSNEWRALINNFVLCGTIAIKINDDVSR
jgi:hypothetical protein